MVAPGKTLLEVFKKAALPVEIERHLRDEYIVDVVISQRRMGGNKSRFAAHHLDDTYAVDRIVRFDMRSCHRLDRFSHSGFKAE